MTDGAEEYFASHRPTLLRSAVLMGCSLEDAEDVVQETLARCHRHWSKVASADRRDAYVFKILVNTLNKRRARRWNDEIPTDELRQPETEEGSAEDDRLTGLLVRQALRDLSVEHRQILVLRFFADLSERDTAETLGIAPGTVKSRTSRALAALSEHPSIAARATW